MGTAPGGALGKNMGVDAVRIQGPDRQLQRGCGSAPGGRERRRSGTNDFHGSVRFTRNAKFGELNYFDRRKPFRRNQFGGTFGGPIKRTGRSSSAATKGCAISDTKRVGVFPTTTPGTASCRARS